MTRPGKEIPRVAKGKRPRYFSDPAVDKLHAIVMTLVGELAVTRDRLDAVERLLERNGTLSREDVAGFIPDDDAETERRAERDAYIARVMRVLTMELEEMRGGTDETTVEATLDALLEDDGPIS